MPPIRKPLPGPTPARDLFITFTNTLEYDHGRAIDHLPDAPSLLTWLRDQHLISDRGRSSERAQLRDDPEQAARRMERFRHLRDLIRATAGEIEAAGSPSPDQVRDLNHILRHGVHYHQLEVDPQGAHYALARVGDRLDQARATIAGTLAEFMAEGPMGRLRICANPGCRWVFLDRSRTGRRRWCDMRTCGNQAKVAAHRARTRRPGSGVPAPAAAG